MALSRPGVGIAAGLSIVLLLALSGCGTPVTEEGTGRTTTASASPSPEPTPEPTEDGGGDEGGGDEDGGEDPAQDRVRTGPVAQYGGPAYGDQGDAEIIEAGLWCKTIAVFWGGDVPDGVRYTFQSAVTDRAGLAVESDVCGSREADRGCLDMTVEANQSQIRCSLVLRPGSDFQDGTAITFVGTLECPSAEICDIVAAREVDPGPPIIVVDPEASDDEEQNQDQDQQEQQDQQDQQDQDQDPDQDQDQDEDQQEEEGSG
ncbi:hypothetical protein Q9R08_07025 [Microbacterium sp. QXD-8]|uniref:Uncharacterized protein n=1 Tax=Microbacterium psychrotolerans TaxID=3068321 RepID=A0ABU0YZG3_9MICO|nr:hypothetical protein [Microbacterium sp. QXD-8]MDQ7877723.1 hypothetical protein [Microbacterium sp. QXD-8]